MPYDRHETIYSEDWYRIWVGRTKGSVIVPITTNGYFGAARDRLPISSIGPRESPDGEVMPQTQSISSKGRRLVVNAPVNMVTLRSGQHWAHAEGELLDDCIDNMRPRLMTGMDYLTQNREDSGTLALRVMTNLDDEEQDKHETSILRHFLSMEHLER